MCDETAPEGLDDVINKQFFAPGVPPEFDLLVDVGTLGHQGNWPPPSWRTAVCGVNHSVEAFCQWLNHFAGHNGVLRVIDKARAVHLPEDCLDDALRWLGILRGRGEVPADLFIDANCAGTDAVCIALFRLRSCVAAHLRSSQPPQERGAIEPSLSKPASGVPRPLEDKVKKRSTVSGEARAKIIAGFAEHHKFDDNSCGNCDPIQVGKFAKRIDVSKSRVSEFLKERFSPEDGSAAYQRYKSACADPKRLAMDIKAMRGELTPSVLYKSFLDANALADDDD